MHSGYIITLDKLSQILFFIFLALLFYCLTDNEISKNNKILKSSICFCLCIITLVGYILPFSAAQMNLSASGVSADKRYYENNKQVSKPADFKVDSYDLEFNFRNDLNAVATIKTNINSLCIMDIKSVKSPMVTMTSWILQEIRIILR